MMDDWKPSPIFQASPKAEPEISSSTADGTPRSAGGVQQLQPTSSVRIKVPAFNSNDLTLWFSILEIQFHTQNIQSDNQKLGLLLSELDPKILAQVSDIITSSSAGDPNIYKKIKERLVKAYAPNSDRILEELLHKTKFTSSRPSHML